jgi:hypothetical protein
VILTYRLFVNINFFLLVLVSFLLPPLFPKKVFFGLAILMFLASVASKKIVRLPLLNPLLLIGFMFFYLCVGGFGNIDFSLALQFFSSVLMALLFYVVIHFDIAINKHVQASGIIFVLIVYYLSLSYFGILANIPGSKYLVDVFISLKLGFIGERSFGTLVLPMLHFVSSPILLILVSGLIIDNKDTKGFIFYLLMLLLLGAVYFSGSRGIFLSTILCIFTMFVFLKSLRWKLLIVISVAIITLYTISVVDFSGVFSLTEQSNSIKLSHIVSYIRHADFANVLFGEGLAAYYYTSGFGRIAAQTELMLLDFFRYFGLINTMLFFALLVFPVQIRARKFVLIMPFSSDVLPYFIAFMFYLLMAMLNPMLLNSYGIIVWYWTNVYRLTSVTLAANDQIKLS